MAWDTSVFTILDEDSVVTVYHCLRNSVKEHATRVVEELGGEARGMLPIEVEYREVVALLLSGNVVKVREVEKLTGVDRDACMEVAKVFLEEGLLVFVE